MCTTKFHKIMLCGPSGFGKTTLAKWISENFSNDQFGEIEFLSGSMSDLIPDTKDITHSEFLKNSGEYLYEKDYQLLNLRHKLFSKHQSFVSDRSYIDLASYFMYKQRDLPQCEFEHFIHICKTLITQECDILILLNFVPEVVNEWVTEDNNHRITNNYFQLQISSIMRVTLQLMGYRENEIISYIPIKGILNKLLQRSTELKYGYSTGKIKSIYGSTKVLVIHEPSLDNRKDIIKGILS